MICLSVRVRVWVRVRVRVRIRVGVRFRVRVGVRVKVVEAGVLPHDIIFQLAKKTSLGIPFE